MCDSWNNHRYSMPMSDLSSFCLFTPDLYINVRTLGTSLRMSPFCFVTCNGFLTPTFSEFSSIVWDVCSSKTLGRSRNKCQVKFCCVWFAISTSNRGIWSKTECSAKFIQSKQNGLFHKQWYFCGKSTSFTATTSNTEVH